MPADLASTLRRASTSGLGGGRTQRQLSAQFGLETQGKQALEQQGLAGQQRLDQIGAQGEQAKKAFQRKTGFARELIGKFDQQDVGTGAELQGPSESEQLLIQAQQEASEKDVNRLQDVLSGAGILSSGTLAVGTGEILGSARAGVARTAAGFAESRLTRRHQNLIAKRQQLTQLVTSILV